jgi:hypothetical protein
MADQVEQDKLHSMGTNVGVLMMAAGGVAAANEAAKAFESKDHTIKHGIHAGLGAAAATIGYEIAKNASSSDTSPATDSAKSKPSNVTVIQTNDNQNSDATPNGNQQPSSRTRSQSPPPKAQRRSSSASSTSSSSSFRRKHHHKIHLAEEVIAAWAIVKKALGDKDHKATHLVEELLGLVGLYGEAKDHHHANGSK